MIKSVFHDMMMKEVWKEGKYDEDKNLSDMEERRIFV